MTLKGNLEQETTIKDLALLVRRLCRLVSHGDQSNPLIGQALDYLNRKTKTTPLRVGGPIP